MVTPKGNIKRYDPDPKKQEWTDNHDRHCFQKVNYEPPYPNERSIQTKQSQLECPGHRWPWRVSWALNLLLCLALLTSTHQSAADQIVADGVIFTSMIRLIAHPDAYDGKRVLIIGYYVAGQELSSLFVNKEDARSGNTQSAAWIDLVPGSTNKLVDLKIKSGTVKAIGTFRSGGREGTGHMGAWPGELREVTFFQRCR